MSNSSTSKATPTEIKAVKAAIAKGDQVPAGFAYNPTFDPPVWKVHGRPAPEHNRPPSGVKPVEQEPAIIPPDVTTPAVIDTNPNRSTSTKTTT